MRVLVSALLSTSAHLWHNPKLPHNRPTAPTLDASTSGPKDILVTDGTDSFYNSRAIFQSLHSHGSYKTITALSTSVANAKKMLLSREARYSGLVDSLNFSDDELSNALKAADVWLALNADEAALPAQIDAAKAAGLQRLFVVLTPDGPSAALSSPDAIQKSLEASGLDYTLMRVGALDPKGSGGGLKVLGVDEPTCAEVSREDVFRFITEALTLPEASGRLFSLCPSADVSQLKEMRQAGCDRREETQALLSGVIVEKLDAGEEGTAAADAGAVAPADEGKSEEEIAAEREEEIQRLMANARKKSIEFKKRLKEEEEAKAKAREERAMYFKSPEPTSDDDAEGGDDDAAAAKTESGPTGEEGGGDGQGGEPSGGGGGDGSSPEPPTDGGDQGGDGGSDEPPLALA